MSTRLQCKHPDKTTKYMNMATSGENHLFLSFCQCSQIINLGDYAVIPLCYYVACVTYSEGFFHPVRWSYGNKPFGNKREDDDEFRRISNSSKSSDKAL